MTEVSYLGSVARYEVRVGDGLTLTAEVHDPDFAALRAVGETVSLWCAADRVFPLVPEP